MATHIETDGLLNPCHCSGRAGFIVSPVSGEIRAACSECPEQTGWEMTKDRAMIAWNTIIEGIKRKAKV